MIFVMPLNKNLCKTRDRSVRGLVELQVLLLLRLYQIDNVDHVEVAVLALVLFLFLMVSVDGNGFSWRSQGYDQTD